MKAIIGLVSCILLALSPVAFTGCANGGAGGVGGVVSDAQAWLNDPKNQALIQEIAQAANILIGAFGKHAATTSATIVGKLSADYPNVPAGALRAIAQNPQAYLKK